MNSTRKAASSKAELNGELVADQGDAYEPARTEADKPVGDFDPAKLQAPTTPTDTGANPFDPESLRLRDDLAAGQGVQEHLTSVAHCKPRAHWWFRVHPDPAYCLTPALFLDLKSGDDDVYMVNPELAPTLAAEPALSRRTVYLAITSQGEPFLWPCRLPGHDGKRPDWIDTPLAAAEQAKTKWTRMFWDADRRRYRILTASAVAVMEPQWPALTLGQLLNLSFRDNFIKSVDHPVLRKLREVV